ncbi:InlB B-repeat-containing protein [Paenibacillus contaminans]|uniref:InlB B-repeat-containing protein n=1 Tax=Paenibacillus contaminans TaxID=450362 RepID=UPI001EE06FDF|nr:InlB B-repeat-containing protein [Paenibacillus contaminans]
MNQGDKRIKMVDASGNLTTVAGNGGTGNYGEGQPATSVPLYNPVDVAIDSQGNLYISDQHRIRKVDTAGKAWSYAGGQEGTNSNQKLSQLQFRNIGGLAIDSAGNMYVADSGNHRIIVIDLVTTSEYNNMNFAGTTGQKGTWDAPLTLTTLDTPKLISVDHKGDLYIPDPQNQLIRSIQTGYMLTYDINGGSGTAPRTVFLKYIKNTNHTVLGNSQFSKTGFTFVGWNTQADGFGTDYAVGSALKMPAHDVKLFAKWETTKYTLSYSAGAGGTVEGTAPQTVLHGGSGSPVTAVPGTGYRFVKWSDGYTGAVRTDTNVSGNINVTAQFEVIRNKVSFESNGGSSVQEQTIFYNDYAFVPYPPNRQGYTFTGWYSDSALNEKFNFLTTPIIAPKTLYAGWEIASYKVSFESNGGSAVTEQNVIYNQLASEPAAQPVREGHTFEGWYTDQWLWEPFDFATRVITGNTTVYAKWEINRYDLNYAAGENGYLQGQTAQSVTHGANGITVYAQPHYGYVFTQWSDGNTNAQRTDTNVKADINVTASFDAIRYKVRFESNGGSAVQEQSIAYNELATKPIEPPVREGYTFDGWYANQWDMYPFNFEAQAIFQDTILSAKWTIKRYVLDYTAGANGSIQWYTPQSVAHGADGTTVTAVPNEGYVFVQWSDGNTSAVRTDTNVKADLQVTASFDIIRYKVNFESNGGSQVPEQTIDHNGYAAAPADQAREGYTFGGWYSDSGLNFPFYFEWMPITGDTTVYAKWTINRYDLYYAAGVNGSIEGQPVQSVEHGADGTTVTAVPNEGYVFVQWSDGNTSAVRQDTNVKADLQVTASFDIIRYKVSFESNGGGAVPEQNIAYNGYATEPADQVREGYTFGGWYSDSGLNTPFIFGATPITQQTTVYAKWTIDSYDLSYTAAANGSIEGQPVQSVEHGADGATVTAVPNEGYVFVQWSDGNTSAVRQDTNVKAGIQVTASFDIIRYKVSFEGNGGSAVPEQDIAYNGYATEPADQVREGYTFGGWYSDSDLNTPFIFGATPITQQTTVYAKWTIDSYDLSYTAAANGSIEGQPVQSVEHGADGATVTAVPNEGYVFVQWSDGNTSAVRQDTNVKAGIQVTASFDIIRYKVSFEGNGGSAVPEQDIAYNGYATEPADQVREGYTFGGWYSDSDLNTPFIFGATPITQQTTVYAKWTINSYDLSYTAGANGSIVGEAVQSVEHGADGATVTAVPNDGYVFVQWSDGNTSAVRTDTNVKADLQVTASFDVIRYKVSFESNGGSAVAEQNIAYNGYATEPDSPMLAGYSLAGWYSDSELQKPFHFETTLITGDTTVYAKWILNPPGAPAIQSAVAGDSTATIYWSAVDGAKGYQVFQGISSGVFGDPVTVGESVYSYQATDLTNGTRYYFVVGAINEGGVSIASNEVSATPKTTPAAPTNVIAVAGDGQATISFTVPTSDGGSIITGYKVISSPDGKTITAAASPITLTGLTNGTIYTFTVQAINSAGSSAASAASNAVTPTASSTGGGTGGGIGGSESTGGTPGGSTPPATTSTTDGKLTLPASSAGETKLGDEIQVTIPAGASDSELKLTVEKVLDTVQLNSNGQVFASDVFELLKNFSENFKQAVTLTFKFDTSKVGDNQRAAIFFYDEVNKEWVEIGGRVEGDTIMAKVDHFTKFAVLIVDEKKVVPVKVSFSDTAGHWAEATIQQAVQQGVVDGYPDGTFKPDATISRAEFAMLLMNALKPSGAGAELSFTDERDIASWAKKAIAQAVQAGIVSGYDDGSFRPAASISRAELAVMIARAAGANLSANEASGFADENEIPDWAKGAVAAVKQLGVISGRDGNLFAPNDTATRAEAVTILMKLLQRDN